MVDLVKYKAEVLEWIDKAKDSLAQKRVTLTVSERLDDRGPCVVITASDASGEYKYLVVDHCYESDVMSELTVDIIIGNVVDDLVASRDEGLCPGL